VKRVLVVGDVIEDVYERCTFRKMCPDAPNVSAVVRQSIDSRPGGAANVAANLCALSANARVSLIGELNAPMARDLKYRTKSRLDMSNCQFADEVQLSKRRIFNGDHMVLRVDRADHVGPFTQEMVFEQLKDYLANNNPDLILLSDYGHGTVGPEALGLLLGYRDRLLVDTKETDLSVFDGSLLCKLNFQEWQEVTRTEAAPERFFKYLVITQGAFGSTLKARRAFNSKLSQTDEMHVRACEVTALDVCGCGDTFLAGLASSILQNGDPYTAMCFATAAAATVVTQSGTAVADRDAALRLLGLEIEK
jgi:D-beta-D-heptose 7-phosphate kinase/D-beta-D-heptose 1-phosphate adenosyltransferase